MKKLIALLLSSAVVCTLLSGCSGSGGHTPPSQAPETAQTTKAAENKETRETEPPSEKAAVKWPEKTVQITVPYKAGGGVDKAARLVCSALEKETGASFVITNKPEVNGIVATNELLKQDPDGYNLEIVSVRDIFGHIVNGIEGVEYDKDSFTYIASLLEPADAIYTQDATYASFDDLIAAAKENPGGCTIAIANNTGQQVLNIINEQLGVTFNGIVYSSGAEAFADLLGGHVDACMVATSFCAQAYENKCAPVVTMTSQKYDVLNGVPCITDLGVKDAVSPMNRLLLGPSGMPEELVDAIVAQLDKIYTADGELIQQINSQYDMPTYLTGDGLKSFIDENFAFRQSQAGGE